MGQAQVKGGGTDYGKKPLKFSGCDPKIKLAVFFAEEFGQHVGHRT
jgi:hypothetical protein